MVILRVFGLNQKKQRNKYSETRSKSLVWAYSRTYVSNTLYVWAYKYWRNISFYWAHICVWWICWFIFICISEVIYWLITNSSKFLILCSLTFIGRHTIVWAVQYNLLTSILSSYAFVGTSRKIVEIKSKPLNHWICCVVSNTTQVLALSQAHIAIFSPQFAPPILKNPIFLRIAYNKHRVVNCIRSARVVIINAIAERIIFL